MTLHIRPFEDDDVAAVVALWQACDLTRPWNNPEADIALARAAPDAEIFIGCVGDRVAASIVCGHDGHRAWLYYLAVDPQDQGNGFGRQITKHAEDWLQSRGAVKVMLMIRPENDKVQAFYESLDYAVEPRIVMSRRLDTGTD
ncbi:MAG: GNAT family acetyltransferase [Alphaproteobacteria bacterium]|nr:GNAT family acetyltransferase [Alphaproteobacteria bacterium]